MQTPTLLRQVRPNWLSWRNLLVILLIFGVGFIQQAAAQSFAGDAITLTQQPTGSASQPVNYAGLNYVTPYSTYTRLGNTTSNPPVASPNLGTYDLNGTSALVLTNGSIDFQPVGFGSPVVSAQIFYRVYQTSLPPTSNNYSQLSLPNSSPDPNTAGLTIYQSGTASIDLLAGLTNGGNYTVDLFFQLTRADGTKAVDPSNTYSLAFYITPPPVTPTGGTTIWQSTITTGGSTDWALASNWSNGVPTATSNAIIPAKTNSAIVYPVLNSTTYNYEVNNLTLQGNTGSSAAQLTITVATLKVYGDINQPAGGLAGNTTNRAGVADPTQNSTIILAGADQIITGQLLVSDIIVAGSGIKSVINTIIPSNIIAFRPASVINGVIVQSAAKDNSTGTVTTVFDTTGNSFISLVSSSIISDVPGDSETNASYIKGVTRADRVLVAGTQNRFGNIGLDLTANHTPGNIFVYRVVGDPLTGPLAAGAVPTKRFYQIKGDDNSANTSTANSSVDVVFHYLDSTDELNGIKEENLTMFSAQQNGAPFRPANGTLDATNNTVTRLALPSTPNYYLTLGDKTNPLPVSLIAFTATRSNQNVLLSWATATEQNSAGFEVQVSTDGASFRKLAFVASQNPNSSQKLAYTYTDAEAGKTGTRYYRLRQLDITGEEAFSPVRVVTLDGIAAATALSAYPNPFADKVAFNLDATALGTNGNAHVQLLDMTGRIVCEQNLTVQNASLTLDNLSDLRSGLYLVRITLPDGSAKTLRVQKQ